MHMYVVHVFDCHYGVIVHTGGVCDALNLWESSHLSQEDRQVEVFHRVALAPGGAIESIDETTVPEENRKLFMQVVNMFGANVLGIDVIFEKGIEIPFTEQKCIFIEVNSRPYIKMHYYPRYGAKQDFEKALKELENLEIDDKDIF